MASVGVGIRIQGAKNAQGQVKRFSKKALVEIQKAAETRAQQSVARFKREMGAEYTSAWATGALAAGISQKTTISGNGVDVKFFITNQRELAYVTALLGGHFQDFPVGPFEILPQTAKLLFIRFPHPSARQFIRGRGGLFFGSKGTPEGEEPARGIRVSKVLWGKRTGGFRRDVLSEVGQDEGALFVKDMQDAVAGAIATLTS